MKANLKLNIFSCTKWFPYDTSDMCIVYASALLRVETKKNFSIHISNFHTALFYEWIFYEITYFNIKINQGPHAIFGNK